MKNLPLILNAVERILFGLFFLLAGLTSFIPSARSQYYDSYGNFVQLTPQLIDEKIALYEWAFQIKFTPRDRAELQRRTIARAGWDPDFMNNFQSELQLWQTIKGQSAGLREFNRQLLFGASLEKTRRESVQDEDLKWFLATYERVTREAGPEKLTREASDAFVDLIWWAAAQIKDRERITPDETFRKLWFSKLAGEFSKFPLEQQRLIARLPLYSEGLMEIWPHLYQEVRQVVLERWKPLVEMYTSPIPNPKLDPTLAAEAARWGRALSQQPDVSARRRKEEAQLQATRRQLEQQMQMAQQRLQNRMNAYAQQGQCASSMPNFIDNPAAFRDHMDRSFSRSMDLMTWPTLSEEEKQWRRSQGRDPYRY